MYKATARGVGASHGEREVGRRAMAGSTDLRLAVSLVIHGMRWLRRPMVASPARPTARHRPWAP